MQLHANYPARHGFYRWLNIYHIQIKGFISRLCLHMYRNLEKRFGVSRWMGEALVYFFGSYASGLKTATSDCDIDIYT